MKPVLVAILALLALHEPAKAAEFNYSNLLHARMQLDKDFEFELHADAYMQLYRPLVYKRSRHDEFQIRQRRRETVALMKQAMQQLSTDDTYTLRTRVYVGAFDFAKQQFYVNQASPTHYWEQSRRYCYNCDLPSRFRVFFGNHELFRNLPMTETQANDFVNRRKDRHGKINRCLYATIEFKLVALKDDKSELLAEIQSAKFFEDRHRTQLVYEVTKPADSVPVTKEKAAEQQAAKKRSALESEAFLHLIGGL